MKSITIIMLFFLFLTPCVHAQNKQMSDIISKEFVESIEARIMKQFKRTECFDENQTYHMVHMPIIAKAQPISKEDFLDGSFINHLKPEKVLKKRESLYLMMSSLIYVRDTFLVGSSGGQQTACFLLPYEHRTWFRPPQDIAVDDLKLYTMPYLFFLHGSVVISNLLFVVDENNEFFVVNLEEKPFKLHPLKEYVEQHWDEGVFDYK